VSCLPWECFHLCTGTGPETCCSGHFGLRGPLQSAGRAADRRRRLPGAAMECGSGRDHPAHCAFGATRQGGGRDSGDLGNSARRRRGRVGSGGLEPDGLGQEPVAGCDTLGERVIQARRNGGVTQDSQDEGTGQQQRENDSHKRRKEAGSAHVLLSKCPRGDASGCEGYQPSSAVPVRGAVRRVKSRPSVTAKPSAMMAKPVRV